MTQIDRTTEHFNAVVRVVVDLDVVDEGAGTDALEGDAVQLVLIVHLEAGEADLRVGDGTGGVVGRGAAEQARRAFAGLFTIDRAAGSGGVGTGIDRRAAVQHQTAPLTLGVHTGRAFNVRTGGEDDRRRCRTVRAQLRTAGHDDVVGTSRTEDRHTRIDRQRGFDAGRQRAGRIGAAVDADEDRTDQLVHVAAGQAQVGGDVAGDLADAGTVDGFSGFRGARRAAGVFEQIEGPARSPVGSGDLVIGESADVIDIFKPAVGTIHVERRHGLLGRAGEHAVQRVVDHGIVRTGQEPVRQVHRIAGALVEIVHAVQNDRLDVQRIGRRTDAGEGGVLVDVDTVVAEVGHDTVIETAGRTFTDQHALVTVVRARTVAVTDQGEVRDHRVGTRLEIVRRVVAAAVVELETLVAGRTLADQHELGAAAPAIGVVHGVVVIAGQHQVTQIDRTAEHLDTVVRVVVDLDVVDLGAGTDALEGDTVQLVLIVHLEAGEADLDVIQDAGVVGCIGAAEQARRAFAGLFAIGRTADRRGVRTGIDRSTAIDDQAAPQALVVLADRTFNVLAGGEDDRRILCALRFDARAASHHDVVGTGRAEQRGTSADRQGGASAAAAGGAVIGTHEGRARDDHAGIRGDRRVGRDVAGDFTGIDGDVAIGDGGFADRTRAAAAGRDQIDRLTAGRRVTAAARGRARVFGTRRGDGCIRARCKERAGRGHKQELAEIVLHRHGRPPRGMNLDHGGTGVFRPSRLGRG